MDHSTGADVDMYPAFSYLELEALYELQQVVSELVILE